MKESIDIDLIPLPTDDPAHLPVMVKEIFSPFTETRPLYLDLTVGEGGHLIYAMKNGLFEQAIAVDADPDLLQRAMGFYKKEGLAWNRVEWHLAHFTEVQQVLGHRKVDAILIDLGLSRFHYLYKGFSYRYQIDLPLDLRYARWDGPTASEILHTYSEIDLTNIFYRYGEEKRSRSIARLIVKERTKTTIATVADLLGIVKKATPPQNRDKTMRRILQALRIEVNQELVSLKQTLPQLLPLLKAKGVLAVLAYHSLEDRIVKQFLRDAEKQGTILLKEKKALRPSIEERAKNPSARSARLRLAFRTTKSVEKEKRNQPVSTP